MTDLFTLQTALAQAINADPVLRLAHTVAWLDPLWQEADDFDLPEGEDDVLPAALHILRRAFPDIYFEALLAIRRNGTAGYAAIYPMLDHLICDAVQQQGIPLENLEWIGYGIPLPAYGAVLDDPDFYTAHPDTIPVLECFGISPEPNPYTIVVPEVANKAAEIVADDLMQQADERWRQVAWLTRWLFSQTSNSCVLCGIQKQKSTSNIMPHTVTIPDTAYTAGRIIAADLEQQANQRYRQVAWLLKWLFSCSNNACVDWNDEMMSSAEPLWWNKDDIALAVEIIAEADTIMADARAGLQWLLSEPQVFIALWNNVGRLYHALEKQPEREPHLRLTWPDLASLNHSAGCPTCPFSGSECQPAQSG